ncbi:MAG TPA: hypothetical protein VJ761_15510 [Ktedonobacteraceae bacterium]|nr:hypothetical protein [Ktedonobacteraceae bacterium]
MKPIEQVRTQPHRNMRRTGRRVRKRTALYAMMVIAPLAWIGLLLFTRLVPPRTTMAFVTVFVLLYVALTSTIAPLAYIIGLRFLSSRLYRTTVRHSLRQGALLALWVVFNLALRALQSWSIFTAVVSLGIVVVIELLALARK